VRGAEHVPDEGAALVVCNHVSFMDALLISACVRRPIRFVMYHVIFDIPLLSFVFRSMKAIPIAGAREDAARLEQAYDAIAAALADGQLVCIFPEGGLTRDGAIGEFRPGMTRILERTPVPVVPLALDGLWRSVFSRNRERWRVARLFPTVRLAAGAPLEPAAAAPAGVREIVAGLQAGATPAAPGLASLSTSQ